MDKAQDKKKLPVATKDKTMAKPGAEAKASGDKARLGAILRPETAAGPEAGSRLKVGAATDKAEVEAEKVAEVVAAPEAADKGKAGEDQKDAKEPAARLPEARGPPLSAPVKPLLPLRQPLASLSRGPWGDVAQIRRLVADNGNQPNTDALAAVPALVPNLAPVSVSAQEETEFDEMSQNDFGELSADGSGVMMKPLAGPHPGHLEAGLSARVRTPGPGAALPAAFLGRIEARLGVSLEAVRVHTGAEATELSSHLGARAFAHGPNIWLASPGDLANTRLMAHEAAHCLQQGAGRPLRSAPTAPRAPPPRAPNRAPIRRLAEGETDHGLLARGAEKLTDRLDSYGLLKVLIGKRLFTGEAVPQDAVSYVGAFMKFVGAEETFENMKASGSLEKGFKAIRDSAGSHDLTFARVTRVFEGAYDNFSWTSPIESFTAIFGPFFKDVLAFAADILKVVAELVAEAFVLSFGPWGAKVWEKIKAIGEVIDLVLADPMGFAMNLLKAVGIGIKGFGERIFSHIKAGLLAWLLGPLVKMGVTLPEKLDLMGIINVILQVLGLTWPQLKPRLIAKLNPHGELKVTAVEKLVEILNILRTEGLSGVWRKFLEYVDNLQGMVLEAIRSWVIRAVVEAGISKLVAWSNPAGALIDILLTIYKLIAFFVEKLDAIIDFASSVFDSIGKIARGQLDDAAKYVEKTLALTIPVILSFLCALLRLPDIASTIRGLITKLREKVAKAVDKVLDFLIGKIKKLIAKLIAKFKGKKGEPEGSVTMQGTPHKLLWEQEGKRRRLYIHTEKQEVKGQALAEAQTKIMSKCAEPLTTVTAPKLGEAGTAITKQEQVEAALATKPESVSASPDKNAARAAVVAVVVPLIEAGTDKKNAATVAVASGQADIDGQPPGAELKGGAMPAEDQKETVEVGMKNMNFRYVIVPEKSDIEGAWGPWSTMTSRREAFKAEMTKQKLDGRYAVDLDHNPEYQILWRLGHTEFSKDQRETGTEGTPGARMFPTISALYGGGKLAEPARKRASADQDRAMAIRYDVHRKLTEKQNAVVADFKALTRFDDKKQKAFVPQVGKTKELMSKDWAGPIEKAANDHQAQVLETYEGFAKDNFVSDKSVEAIKANGGNMVKDGLSVIRGSKIEFPTGEAAPGFKGGIGMAKDPVDAEYLDGDYDSLAEEIRAVAKAHYGALDKHHLIEETITKKLQQTVNGADLLPALKEPSETVMSQSVGGVPLRDTITAGLEAVKAKTPALSGMDVAKKVPAFLGALRIDKVSPMNAKNTKMKGYAIAILHKINGVLGAQDESNVERALDAHMGASLKAAGGKATQMLTDGLKAVTISASLQPDDAESALGEAAGKLRADFKSALSADFQAAAKAGLPLVIDQLTANAHANFTQEVQNADGQTSPPNGAFPEGSEAAEIWTRLRQRYTKGPGNLANVQAQNRKCWVA